MSKPEILYNKDETGFGEGAFFCVEGIVARNDDPENRCRIQCAVPMIDDDEIHEIWARRVQLYVGDSGFGDYFIPEVGAEIIIWGKLGDTNSLFYAPLYNETHHAPPEFPDKSAAGVRVPLDLKLSAGQLAKLKGNNATVEALLTALLKGTQVNVKGTTISIDGSGAVSITGGAVKISGATVTIEGRLVKKVGPPI